MRDYERFLERNGVDKVYTIMIDYRDKLEKKEIQLDYVDKKFEGYRVFQEKEKKKLQERVEGLEEEIVRIKLGF